MVIRPRPDALDPVRQALIEIDITCVCARHTQARVLAGLVATPALVALETLQGATLGLRLKPDANGADPPARHAKHWLSPARPAQRGANRGGRFSRKARTPSVNSGLSINSRWRSAS